MKRVSGYTSWPSLRGPDRSRESFTTNTIARIAIGAIETSICYFETGSHRETVHMFFFISCILGCLAVLVGEALAIPLVVAIAMTATNSGANAVTILVFVPVLLVAMIGFILGIWRKNWGLLVGAIAIPFVELLLSAISLLFNFYPEDRKLDLIRESIDRFHNIEIDASDCSQWCRPMIAAGKRVIVTDALWFRSGTVFFAVDDFTKCKPSASSQHFDVPAPDIGVPGLLSIGGDQCVSGLFIANPEPRIEFLLSRQSSAGSQVLYSGASINTEPHTLPSIDWDIYRSRGLWPFGMGIFAERAKSLDELTHIVLGQPLQATPKS